MNSTQISRGSAGAMCDMVLPKLQYLGQLRRRVDRMKFPPDDPMRRDVERAFDAIHALRMNLHYMSCAGASTERNKLDSAMA